MVMPATVEDASLRQGLWELGQVSSTCPHFTLDTVVLTKPVSPKGRGALSSPLPSPPPFLSSSLPLSDVWVPLPTTHHLASAAACSPLQETCCALASDSQSMRPAFGPGLLLGPWLL